MNMLFLTHPDQGVNDLYARSKYKSGLNPSGEFPVATTLQPTRTCVEMFQKRSTSQSSHARELSIIGEPVFAAEISIPWNLFVLSIFGTCPENLIEISFWFSERTEMASFLVLRISFRVEEVLFRHTSTIGGSIVAEENALTVIPDILLPSAVVTTTTPLAQRRIVCRISSERGSSIGAGEVFLFFFLIEP